MSTDDQRREQQAADLDDLARVPDEVLSELVARRGLCLWEITSGDPPAWSGQGPPDRELAARLCAGCPVRLECLEFELRTAGADTVGVWGGLSEDDRRALHAMWSVRAARRRPGPDETSDETSRDSGQEGGEW
jgi:WhiB family redox-sensing transcriptional regulator